MKTTIYITKQLVPEKRLVKKSEFEPWEPQFKE